MLPFLSLQKIMLKEVQNQARLKWQHLLLEGIMIWTAESRYENKISEYEISNFNYANKISFFLNILAFSSNRYMINISDKLISKTSIVQCYVWQHVTVYLLN